MAAAPLTIEVPRRGGRPGALAVADPERRCAALARSGGPLRRVLAALARRFVARRGWERLGHARLGDYARERLGLSARELQDLARVDAALATLPRLEGALVMGALPWTKVRLLARAARSEDEARWIAFARRVPVRQLETHVRAVDAATIESGAADPDSMEGEGRREGVSLCVPRETHARWQLGWRLVRRVAGEALDVGQCAEWICAEVLSAMPVEVEGGAEAAGLPRGMLAAERGRARRRQRRASADACVGQRLREAFAPCADEEPAASGDAAMPLPAFVAELMQGLDTADAFTLDVRLRCAVALEQRREADLGALLLRVFAEGWHRLRGFPGLEAYATDRLGLSARKAWALLRVERAARRCPELRAAYRQGRISWVQAQALVGLLTAAPEHAPAWVAHAGRVTVRRLRDDVDRAVLLAEEDPEAFSVSGGVPELEGHEGARLQTGARARESESTPQWAPAGKSRIFFTAEAAVARLFRATLATVQRGLCLKTPGEALDVMLEHCFHAWGLRDPVQERERKRRYRIFERDGWRCTVPGCSSYRDLQAHHIRFRSRGGGDEDENQITLCAWHHLRGVHAERVIRIGMGPRFELGIRPDGSALAVYGGNDVRLSG